MKAQTLRTFLHVHTWMGLLAGMALFIAFYAGAITVFADEIHHWEHRTGSTQMQDLDAAQTLVAAVRERHPEASDFYLQLATPSEPRHVLHWDSSAPDGAELEREYQLGATGQLQLNSPEPGLAEFLYRLHYTAGIPNPWGMYFLGVVSLLYGLALVSGVVLYAPVFLKDLFALRLGRNIKRTWQDIHNIVGVFSLPFHVIFAWSGAVLGIGTLLLLLYQPLFDGKLMDVLQADFELAPRVAPSTTPTPLLEVPTLLARARAAAPGLEAASMSFHLAGDAHATVEVYGRIASRRLADSGGVALNAANGQVMRVADPNSFSPGTTLLRTLQMLHFGHFGQYAVKWLYFLLGLAGAFLFYTGNLLWIEARRKRRGGAQPARTVWMAKLTLGVCIGCMAGISAAMLAEHALPLDLVGRAAWQERTYFIVFTACLAWSAARRPAPAAFEMLVATSLLTLLVPSASLVLGNAGWSGAGAGARAGIDLAAMVMAAAFAWMAIAVRRRGRMGDPSSVWAAPMRSEPHG